MPGGKQASGYFYRSIQGCKWFPWWPGASQWELDWRPQNLGKNLGILIHPPGSSHKGWVVVCLCVCVREKPVQVLGKCWRAGWNRVCRSPQVCSSTDQILLSKNFSDICMHLVFLINFIATLSVMMFSQSEMKIVLAMFDEKHMWNSHQNVEYMQKCRFSYCLFLEFKHYCLLMFLD